jgi:hypothetical protein
MIRPFQVLMWRIHKAVFLGAIVLLLFRPGGNALASPSDYSAAIRLSVDRWLSVQKPSGFFPYGYDFLADKGLEPKTMSAPNLTRQAGTASVIADYYLLTRDERARPAIKSLLTAFGRHSLPIGKSRMQSLVEATHLLSMPIGRYKIHAALERFGLLYEKAGPGKVVSPTNDYSKAHTGTLALALLTEVRYARATADNNFAGLRNAWLEGLIGLWIPGDGFRQFPTSIDATPYFDGEGWLALAEYHRAFPQDRRVAEILADVDDALMKKYGRYGNAYKIDFFHWGTMAAAARYAHTKERKFLAFLKDQTRVFLERKKRQADVHNNCASIEGVADVLGALIRAGEGDNELAGQGRNWVAVELGKVKRMQIQPGQKELAFSRAKIVAPRLRDFAGAFRGGVYRADTRVDYAQHCVSAMVKLLRNEALREESPDFNPAR